MSSRSRLRPRDRPCCCCLPKCTWRRLLTRYRCSAEPDRRKLVSVCRFVVLQKPAAPPFVRHINAVLEVVALGPSAFPIAVTHRAVTHRTRHCLCMWRYRMSAAAGRGRQRLLHRLEPRIPSFQWACAASHQKPQRLQRPRHLVGAAQSPRVLCISEQPRHWQQQRANGAGPGILAAKRGADWPRIRSERLQLARHVG